MVVAVTDGPRLSLAGRVVLPLAVALTLLWSGTSAQPEMGGAPPSQPGVQATPQLPHGILGGHCPWSGRPLATASATGVAATPVAVLAAALAGAVAAATRRSRVARARRLDRRLLAFGPRAPPFRS